MYLSENYKIAKRSKLNKLSVSDISVKLPDLKNSAEHKTGVIAKWITEWITKDLASGKIHYNDLIPSKSDFAYLLGVSIGTVQNAIRYVEDLGYLESKQCVGTMIKNRSGSEGAGVRKLTSKKDFTMEAIKKIIIDEDIKIGQNLPSAAQISAQTGFAVNMVRLSLETLAQKGYIKKADKSGKTNCWVVSDRNFTTSYDSTLTKAETLVDMVAKELEDYINSDFQLGDKLPSHQQLSKTFKVSVKTIHDAVKVLSENGIVQSKRGTYGTIVIKKSKDAASCTKPETSIFAPAKDAAFYHYEKVQYKIKKMIAQEYEIGDKLPSIKELSKTFDLSPNTIRQAFHNLGREGYLVFSRGRYGGTFIIDIPEIESQSFKWLALNPQYAKEYSEKNQV